ncbi:MAG: leucine-rich repeat domain-containing protein, partial [Desulfobacteraceae bacterium]|nr:leucine-rich repeat domain-containing protein [Desulfobacteraceae bacterium]
HDRTALNSDRLILSENKTAPEEHKPFKRKCGRPEKGEQRVVSVFSCTPEHLRSNKIPDISALKELKNLTKLELGWNEISDISILKELKSLTVLFLHCNKILNISVLKNLKNLAELILAGNKISDISAVKKLPNLTYLDLESNHISDISALKDLKNLTYLSLFRNEVSDISGLKELKNLVELNLYENKVSDISALEDLKNLKKLNLVYNDVSDIFGLKELKNLEKVDLRGNPIEIIPKWICDFSKMDVSWETCVSDNFINFYGNPVKGGLSVEIIKKGKKAIKEWFSTFENEKQNQKYKAQIIQQLENSLYMIFEKVDISEITKSGEYGRKKAQYSEDQHGNITGLSTSAKVLYHNLYSVP